ncbi:MAG: alkaline phosphatase [Odoribacteraceae bacterium]|nr:alkaline phosphatase [Odoribacteraceae bacterium]
MNSRIIALCLACCLSTLSTAQERGAGQEVVRAYTANQNAHAHNDYNHPLPFHEAYAHRFASIEVDVVLDGDELYVAHEAAGIDRERTFERLYLRPLLEQIALNGGTPYPGGGELQLLVDLKSDADTTLRRLERALAPVRHHFDPHGNPAAVRVVISGNVPPPGRFDDYDPLFFFDGNPRMRYTREQDARVPLHSISMRQFTAWNGLGRLPERERRAITALVDSLHRAGKKVRFWGNPDTKTLWQAFIKMGVDYLNTDHPAELANFLERRERQRRAPAGEEYIPRTPSYRGDGISRKPRNVILLISDGAGLAHLWAAATANGGALNVTRFKNAGFLITTPADDYNTDSAAAGTAIATGKKTRNRYIGVDADGASLVNLPEALSACGVTCGIITNDNLTGATPASFYAHRPERDMSDSIARDLLASPLALAVGGKPRAFERGALEREARQAGFRLVDGVAGLEGTPAGERAICFDGDEPARGRRLIEEAFDACVRRLAVAGKGFFLMVEGAKIDAGGHANDLTRCVDEYLSFDRVVGKALQFADTHGETLVIVTSDHETGGLSLVDGDYATGELLGDFATSDHTGLPVPLLAYGPGATAFRGFMQNSDLFDQIVRCLGGK